MRKFFTFVALCFSALTAMAAVTLTPDQEYTSISDLDGKTFAIVNKAESKALYGTNAQNLGYDVYEKAFVSSNSGYLWKAVKDADIDAYYLQLVTPTGEDYNCWNMGGVLNSQGEPQGWACSFILGTESDKSEKGQDIDYGALYELVSTSTGWTIKNVGTSMYIPYSNGAANSVDPTYWSLCSLKEVVVEDPEPDGSIEIPAVTVEGWPGATGVLAPNWANATPYTFAEAYKGGALSADFVMSTELTLEPNTTYSVVLVGAASFTSGRGFECTTGDASAELAGLFVETANGLKYEYIPVVDRTTLAADANEEVTLEVKTGEDGKLTAGIKNFKEAGNWYACAIKSIKMVPALPALQQTYPQANTTVNELPEYVTFMFDQVITSLYAAAIQAGENEPLVIDNAYTDIIDGNTVKIELTQKLKNQLPPTGHFTVYLQLTEELQYEINFDVAPEFAIESSSFTYAGGKLVFNQNVDILTDNKLAACYVSSVKTKNIATQATLMLDDEAFNVINVEFAEGLEEGEYTLDIEDGVIVSTNEEPLASVKVEFSVVKPELQSTYPEVKTTVTELPDYVTFMFDAEIPSVKAVAIGCDENEPVNVELSYVDIIDGNTVKVTLSEKIKNQLPANGGFTVYVQLTENWAYDTFFNVAPEFGVESTQFNAEVGQIVFNQNVDFAEDVDQENVVVNVVGAETKQIACKAQLYLNEENYAAIDVIFVDGEDNAATALAPGKYVIELAQAGIISVNGEAFNQNVEFEVAGDPIVGEGLTLAEANLGANGGSLKFSEAVYFVGNGEDFVETITCNVAGTKTKDIATQATLECDWDDWTLVNVTFANELEDGTYTLDIPANVIAGNDTGNVYAGGQIQFTVSVSTSINGVKVLSVNDAVFTVNGVRTNNAKGLVIINGKKMMVK